MKWLERRKLAKKNTVAVTPLSHVCPVPLALGTFVVGGVCMPIVACEMERRKIILRGQHNAGAPVSFTKDQRVSIRGTDDIEIYMTRMGVDVEVMSGDSLEINVELDVYFRPHADRWVNVGY